MDLIKQLETEEISRLGKNVPDFKTGNTVVVNVNVVEGDRKRVQAYEGMVIAKRNRGLNSSFVVRKISSGEGVERTFQTHSPLIASIEVKRKGDVSRAKLYYLRKLSGKAARIKERLEAGAEDVLPPLEEAQPEAKPQPKADATPEVKKETKAAAKKEAKTEAKKEAKTEAKKESKKEEKK